jgi:2-amino-4-hydroxy-6-hydroxymethyldihydropteridine diphosphokinase
LVNRPPIRDDGQVRAYVGLGANLGDREATIRAALEQLAAEPGVEVVAVSPLIETAPVGIADQPRFLNGAAALETELGPRELLHRLLGLERRLGRTREGPRFGPRTIDLDLLLYGEQVVAEPGLAVPHPRLHERLFALEPLFRLDPGLSVPGRGTVAALRAGLQSGGCPTSTSSTSTRRSSSSG